MLNFSFQASQSKESGLDRSEEVNSLSGTDRPWAEQQKIEMNYALLISRMLPELLHEANNELAVLQGSGELLSLTKRVPELEKLERRGQTIVKASSRLAGLCRILERNPSGGLTKSSCELTTLIQSLHDELTMLNSFDTIQWIIEPSEPVSVECPGWVVKQIVLNLMAKSLASLSSSSSEKRILTQFTSSDTDVTFHWQDTAQITNAYGDGQSGLADQEDVWDFQVCELLISQFGGRISVTKDSVDVISVTFPRVAQL